MAAATLNTPRLVADYAPPAVLPSNGSEQTEQARGGMRRLLRQKREHAPARSNDASPLNPNPNSVAPSAMTQDSFRERIVHPQGPRVARLEQASPFRVIFARSCSFFAARGDNESAIISHRGSSPYTGPSRGAAQRRPPRRQEVLKRGIENVRGDE